MSKIFGWAKALLPETLLWKIAFVAFVFALGWAAGNVHATRREVADMQTRADIEKAAMTQGVVDEMKRRNAVALADAKLERKANDTAGGVLSAGNADADARLAAAQAQLTRERAAHAKDIQTNEGLRHVNAMLGSQILAESASTVPVADRSCVWSADTRRMLDNAAGAIAAGPAAPGAPEAGAQSRTAGAGADGAETARR